MYHADLCLLYHIAWFLACLVFLTVLDHRTTVRLPHVVYAHHSPSDGNIYTVISASALSGSDTVLSILHGS